MEWLAGAFGFLFILSIAYNGMILTGMKSQVRQTQQDVQALYLDMLERKNREASGVPRSNKGGL